MIFYAHTTQSDTSTWQTVQDHLENTARIARDLGRDSGCAEFAYLAARLHDIGKYSLAFQDRLLGKIEKVDHSTAGAKEVVQLFNQTSARRILAQLLAYCIAGHHGGLPDYGSVADVDTDATLLARLKRDLPAYQDYAQEIDISTLSLPERLPIKPAPDQMGFSISFFTRMVYSILVDADFIETETFMQQQVKPRGGYPGIEALNERFNQYLKRFDNPVTPINVQRSATLKACIAKAKEKPGFFTLTVPTGGGKTFASLAFALNHAATHDLKRIIYVIPYTSIIEQNAGVIKDCLGAENVLEHHSNFDWKQAEKRLNVEAQDDQTNNAVYKLRLAAENWDIPVVVTTNVQFFESLFASRSSRCRKLHNLAKSVIIFDEAQMLPRDFIKPCMGAVAELVKNYGASVVFCTATQPSIEKFLPKDVTLQELEPDPQHLFDLYKRVEVKNLGRVADEVLLQKINAQAQVLCIVNTRKHARGLFAGIPGEGGYHLSTLMCPAHRKAVIAEIRERLRAGLVCRVISTQIMEAGIDVDFPVGFRSISGLDSIIQAAGRVNREGTQPRGSLFVFEPDSSFVKRTPGYIQQGAEVALNILRSRPDPISVEAIRAYYALLYNLQDAKAFDRERIFSLFNLAGMTEPAFQFKTAAEKFKLIEDDTLSVIIPFDQEATWLLEQLKVSEFPMSFARKLQPYTVNIYEKEFEALQGLGVMDTYGETYAVLNDMRYYDPKTGIVIPEIAGARAIFFDG